MQPLDLVDQGLLLRVTVREDDVRLVDSDHRSMRRNDHHVEPVRLTQLERGVLGGSGHPTQACVSAQEMLKRDRAEDLAARMPVDALFGFDGGLKTVWPMTIEDDTVRELVDDLEAAVAHDVVDIASEEHGHAARN